MSDAEHGQWVFHGEDPAEVVATLVWAGPASFTWTVPGTERWELTLSPGGSGDTMRVLDEPGLDLRQEITWEEGGHGSWTVYNSEGVPTRFTW